MKIPGWIPSQTTALNDKSDPISDAMTELFAFCLPTPMVPMETLALGSVGEQGSAPVDLEESPLIEETLKDPIFTDQRESPITIRYTELPTQLSEPNPIHFKEPAHSTEAISPRPLEPILKPLQEPISLPELIRSLEPISKEVIPLPDSTRPAAEPTPPIEDIKETPITQRTESSNPIPFSIPTKAPNLGAMAAGSSEGLDESPTITKTLPAFQIKAASKTQELTKPEAIAKSQEITKPLDFKINTDWQEPFALVFNSTQKSDSTQSPSLSMPTLKTTLLEIKPELTHPYTPSLNTLYTAKIKVHPDSLGEITAQINIQQGKAELHFMTESTQTKQFVENNLQHLQLGFNNANLELSQVTIDMQFNKHNQQRPERLEMMDDETIKEAVKTSLPNNALVDVYA